MKATIHVHIKFPSWYDAPAAYQAELERLDVHDGLSNFDAEYVAHIRGEVAPNKWSRVTGQDGAHTYLEIDSEKLRNGAWEALHNLSFEDALAMVSKKRLKPAERLRLRNRVAAIMRQRFCSPV